MEYEVIIGLETHIQLNTASKIFCACKADSWNDPPNTNVCPVCMGLPGVLPVLNRAAVEKALQLALAVGAEVQPVSYFARKNYFYPDLPKGYQISQYDQPLARGGALDIPLPDGRTRRVRITKLHLEEDAGKTKRERGVRLIDFNRCGVPLIEMVTEPDLRSPDEAAHYLLRLRQLIRWLGISEGDMEKGHLRCDANVSIRPKGADYFNPKTEIKNVNSIDAVREAIAKEVERQIREMEAGRQVEPWTLEWDEHAGVLRKMRSKETEADYRYFREPDLLPLEIDAAWLEQVRAALPELPLARRARFQQQYGLSAYEADILTGHRALADYFEALVETYNGPVKAAVNWMLNEVLRLLNEEGLTADRLRLTPQRLARLLQLLDAGTINRPTAKRLLRRVHAEDREPEAIVEAEGLAQVSDTDALRRVCQEVVAENPAEVAKYRSGKTGLLGWFVGQVMRKTRGKANPQEVRRLLQELLDAA